jgi:hypothetical protein
MHSSDHWVEMQPEEGASGKDIIEINSLTHFLEFIIDDPEIEKTETVYRGHANLEWRTVPSLFRSPTYTAYEHDMGRDLIAHFPQDFHTDTTMFDRLVRMQHYGLPTRLVDVTVNPLVALYFACGSERREGSEIDGQVIAYRVKANRTKYYDSDTVSVLANMANLDSDDKRLLKQDADNSSSNGARFNASPTAQRLVRFIRNEKPHFEPEINPADLYRPIYVRPRLSNRRIIAQSGAFLIYGFPVEKGAKRFRADIKQRFYRIPGVGKEAIRADLARLGITGSTLFPELDKAADYIRERYNKRWMWDMSPERG